jgi:[acyl-carrier-protein] S-malonyltransferase
MKTTFLYPGQGSQAIGMGVAVADAFPQALAVFDCASELAGYDVYEMCATGPAEMLSTTLYTQPLLYTVEAAITDVIRNKGVKPLMAAGHSLGEFAAWYAAGVYSFEDGFRLVMERGRIMNEADPEGRGAMAAVIGLTAGEVESVCNGIEGVVAVANYNSPLQVVISGEKTAVEAAGAELRENGAKRIIPLNVSGAFHSPLMDEACELFADVVDETPLSDAEIPVFSNVTASPVTDADDIRDLIIRQITSPVEWTGSIENMIKNGMKDALELGPGGVVAGLVKRIDSSVNVRSVSDPAMILEVLRG